MKRSDFPLRCMSSDKMAETFPLRFERLGKSVTYGTVLRPTRIPDVYRVKWDDLKTKEDLHSSFFQFMPAPQHPVTRR